MLGHASGRREERMQAAIAWQCEAAGFPSTGRRVSQSLALGHVEGSIVLLQERALGGQRGLAAALRGHPVARLNKHSVLQWKRLQVVQARAGERRLDQVLPRTPMTRRLTGRRTATAAASPSTRRIGAVLLMR